MPPIDRRTVSSMNIHRLPSHVPSFRTCHRAPLDVLTCAACVPLQAALRTTNLTKVWTLMCSKSRDDETAPFLATVHMNTSLVCQYSSTTFAKSLESLVYPSQELLVLGRVRRKPLHVEVGPDGDQERIRSRSTICFLFLPGLEVGFLEHPAWLRAASGEAGPDDAPEHPEQRSVPDGAVQTE
jgi:hypothetical protein